MMPMQDKGHEEPSDVAADEGNVFIEGPDDVAFALTPEAAAETGDRLCHQASVAADQRDGAAHDRNAGEPM